MFSLFFRRKAILFYILLHKVGTRRHFSLSDPLEWISWLLIMLAIYNYYGELMYIVYNIELLSPVYNITEQSRACVFVLNTNNFTCFSLFIVCIDINVFITSCKDSYSTHSKELI